MDAQFPGRLVKQVNDVLVVQLRREGGELRSKVGTNNDMSCSKIM